MISEQDLRLDALAGEILCLKRKLVNADRAAREITPDEREHGRRQLQYLECKNEMEEALLAYFIESELARRGLRRVA